MRTGSQHCAGERESGREGHVLKFLSCAPAK